MIKFVPLATPDTSEEAMTKKRLFHLLVAVTTLLALTSSIAAQSKPRSLDKDTFFDMESIGGVNISPDGKQIVFSRSLGGQAEGSISQHALDRGRRWRKGARADNRQSY